MKTRFFSPLTRRILTVNILPLALLVAGILYLDEYRDGLIEAELAALETQAEIFAGALGEGAIGTRPDGAQFIRPGVARPMLRRLTVPTRIRARVFKPNGIEIADSRFLSGIGGVVQVEMLPLADSNDLSTNVLNWIYDKFLAVLPQRDKPMIFPEILSLNVLELPVMQRALAGSTATSRWSLPKGQLLLGAVAPIQRFKRVLGTLLLTAEAEEIDATIRAVRFDILKVFAIVLGVTVLLSLYLAGTIGRPVRRLAAAADVVRTGHGRADSIPDFTRRRDEIGELSESLRDMTEALWQRMEANESFAADVAHEIKNPLTSLRSAVETAARVTDPEKQYALMDIIQDDVKRLDRLISDISDASRLDAELARGQMESVDLYRLLSALVQLYQATSANNDSTNRRIFLSFRGDGSSLVLFGLESRLVQVFENLISNAQSFMPFGGEISLSARRERSNIIVRVEDQGPGIPNESLSAIFQRFYSERPAEEHFGQHSGLGLSISRQIVDAHGGTIHAENILGEHGECLGARFVVTFPAMAG